MGVLLKLCKANLSQLKDYKKSFKKFKKDIIDELKIHESNFNLVSSLQQINSYCNIEDYIDKNYCTITEDINNSSISDIIISLDYISCSEHKVKNFKNFLNDYLILLKDCIISEVLVLSKPFYKKILSFEKDETVNDYTYTLIQIILEENSYNLCFCVKNNYNKSIYYLNIEDISLMMLIGLITKLKYKIVKQFPGGIQK